MKRPHLLLFLALILPLPAFAVDGFRPDRMMLTWREDPTTTMVVQWLAEGELFPVVPGTEATSYSYAIPRISGSQVDGSGNWWDEGLVLDFFADNRHAMPSPDDLHAEARLGWSEQGLHLLVRVVDDISIEEAELQELWRGDSLELFLSDGVGSENRLQVAVSPGRDPELPARHIFYPKEGGPSEEELSVRYASQRLDDGYRMEILFPWSNLPGFDATTGSELAFQMYVNDRDGERRGDWKWVGLHPQRDASRNPRAMFPFHLAETANGGVRIRTALSGGREDTTLELYASIVRAGQPVQIFAGDQLLASGTLEESGNRAMVELALPQAPNSQRWGSLYAEVGGERTWLLEAPTEGYYLPSKPTTLTWWEDGSPDQKQEVVVEGRSVRWWPGMFIHQTELTGLKPATLYRFQGEGEERVFAFRTMPTDLSEPMMIAVGGDIRHRQEWMERMNRVAMTYNPDFMIWGGDLAYADARTEQVDRWIEWFEAIHNSMIDADGRMVPVVVGIGNHEVLGGYYHRHPEYQQTDEWRAEIGRFFYQFFPFPGQPGYGALDFGDYLSFLVLDSDHSNPVEGVQTEWLAQALAERAHIPHRFPVYHVPAYPSVRDFSGRSSEAVREHWVPLFEQHGIRVAFENHDHAYKRTIPLRGGQPDPEGIVYIGDGAWGVGTREVHEASDTWYLERSESVRHAIMLQLHNDQMHMIMVSEEGEIIDRWPNN